MAFAKIAVALLLIIPILSQAHSGEFPDLSSYTDDAVDAEDAKKMRNILMIVYYCDAVTFNEARAKDDEVPTLNGNPITFSGKCSTLKRNLELNNYKSFDSKNADNNKKIIRSLENETALYTKVILEPYKDHVLESFSLKNAEKMAKSTAAKMAASNAAGLVVKQTLKDALSAALSKETIALAGKVTGKAVSAAFSAVSLWTTASDNVDCDEMGITNVKLDCPETNPLTLLIGSSRACTSIRAFTPKFVEFLWDSSEEDFLRRLNQHSSTFDEIYEVEALQKPFSYCQGR